MTLGLALLINENTLDEIMPYITVSVLTCLFVLGISAVQTWYLYRSWVKRKDLNRIFPFWENTRKPFIWWICWSIADWLFAIMIVLIIALCRPEVMMVVVGAFLGIFLYHIFLKVLQVIAQNIIIKKYKNSNKNNGGEKGE